MPFVSYAQNFEDVMLWRALGALDRGCYIDVGAADPVDMSVTKAFYDAGWRGVNIEPGRHYFERLREARPGDVTLDVALAEAPGTRTFYEIPQTGLSTLHGEIASGHRQDGYRVAARPVRLMTLAEVCETHAPGEVHFLKIDVEGAEAEVLAGADFAAFRPWIVLLEATRPMTTETAADWEPGLLAAGYVFVWFDGLNRFYVARERHAELEPHFRLPPNSFDGFVVYDEKGVEAARRVREQVSEIALLEQEMLLLRSMQARDEARNTALEGWQIDLTREVAALKRAQTSLQDEIRYLAPYKNDLEKLVFSLRWHDGPRALRLVLPLARAARRLMGRVPKTPPAAMPAAARDGGDPDEPKPEPALSPAGVASRSIGVKDETRPAPLRRAVHQFHPGVAYGDAVTQSMLLTRRILRGLGYRSDIYIQYPDDQLDEQFLMLDDLPEHDDYVLIVLHSLGYEQAARIAALPAPKILMYHNITPAHLLAGVPGLARFAELGREQLDFWRDRTATALAVSEFNALELRRHGYQSVAVCPLLFDIEALRARAAPGAGREADQPLTVLFVGRIVESKGQVELVDAFAAFRARYGKPCRLVLVGRSEGGSDSYVAGLYRRIGEHGLRGVVEVTGQVSDAALIDWYDKADLYVSLSSHEGFGVPLIEAMAHDLPVIAYAAGAIPYTMNGAGRIVRSTDPGVMAREMLELATDADLRRTIVAEQRRTLDRFALSRHVPALIAALARAGAATPVAAATRDALARHLTIAVAGHVNGTYSLASVNRSLALALNDAHLGRVRIMPVEQVPTDDLSGVPAAELAAVRALAGPAGPPSAPLVVISQHYPIHVPATPCDLVIALFFWEESLIPWEMVEQLNRSFKAVFAPSRFVAKALIDSGVAIPVRAIGYAPRLDRFAALAAERQTQPAGGKFTFLHVSSAFPRKGVDLLLEAFAAAFAGHADSVRLVIKSFPNPHNEVARQIEQLRATHPALPEIVLIDRDLAEDDMLALYRDADAMVLPSRGEGFNLPAAEAMAAGIPLIVTGAGGHVDFIEDRDAILLPWRMEPSRSHFATGEALWLAPDLQSLIDALAALFDDAKFAGGEAAARAARARAAVPRRLDRAAWAKRVTDAAVDLLLTPPPPPRRFGWISSWNVRCGVAEYTRHLVGAFSAFAGPHDRLTVFADDRIAALTETVGGHTVEVVPAWTLGGVDTIGRLAGAVSRNDPDVLMIEHQPGLIHWPGLVRLLADQRLADRVVVITLHTTLDLLSLPADGQAAVIDALRVVARIVVHTVADANFLLERGLSDNVVLMAQGAPAPRSVPAPRSMAPRTDAPVIGCYGFLLPSKGIGRLIEAIPALRETWPLVKVRLVNALYGAIESDDEFNACMALAAKLGVRDCIEWVTDFLPHERSMELLRGCDLIVLPYRQTPEASSAALRSCLASLTPVVVTPIPIFDEAGDAVARFEADTPEAIAAGIAGLLADSDARTALADAARRWLGERSWEAIARRTHGMLAGLLAARAPDFAPAAFDQGDDRDEPMQPFAIQQHAHGRARPQASVRDPWRETYSPLASQADVIACFRLLLGRVPHAEEWSGHSAHVGDNLAGVVSSYLNSLEFSRRGLLAQDMPADTVIADLAEFRIFSNLADDAVGKVVRDGNYEPEVSAIFRRVLRPGMGVLDIGANIGYFSLLSATLVGAAGHVFAVEPNGQNAKLLEASRRLNGFDQITLVHIAAGAETGILALHTSHSTGTTSGLPDEIGALLAARIVPSVALDAIVPHDQRIDLIKIDVDGGEYVAMRGCQEIIRRHRPAIISEFSPELLPGISGVSGEDYLRWFGQQGYEVAVIEPDGSLTPMGQDWTRVIGAYRRRGIDHIDIFATPMEDAP